MQVPLSGGPLDEMRMKFCVVCPRRQQLRRILGAPNQLTTSTQRGSVGRAPMMSAGPNLNLEGERDLWRWPARAGGNFKQGDFDFARAC